MFYTNYENEEQELLRRLSDIDSWANKNNVDQSKDDVEFILNDIDQQMKSLEEMISKYEVRKKKLLKFGNFFAGVFFGSIGYYITTMILGVHFSPAIYFLLFGVMAVSLITAWICFAKTVPTKEMYRLSDKIKEGRKFATLYTWWYEALCQAYIKGVYKRVYINAAQNILYKGIVGRERAEIINACGEPRSSAKQEVCSTIESNFGS